MFNRSRTQDVPALLGAVTIRLFIHDLFVRVVLHAVAKLVNTSAFVDIHPGSVTGRLFPEGTIVLTSAPMLLVHFSS